MSCIEWPLSRDAGNDAMRCKTRDAKSRDANVILLSLFANLHRVLQGALPGATTCLHFSKCSRPFFKASKAPFLTFRVATPSGAPRQAPLEICCFFGFLPFVDPSSKECLGPFLQTTLPPFRFLLKIGLFLYNPPS